MASFLPYHEPDTPTLLTQASFLILLNILNYILDRTIYCGLIGQILLGIAFGTPGAKWVDTSIETVISQLGYLGLILVVYEGGLSTSFRSLRANLLLSAGVALTGISCPIGLSYVLVRLIPGTTGLQAFAAGAALCSTSLGTTFTVLSASGLVRTRLGVVLATAAMLDDVVGLVMVQVISNLGAGGEGDFRATTVVRPVFVSVGFAVLVPLAACLVVRPLTVWVNGWRKGRVEKIIVSRDFVLVVHTLHLLGMVAASSYAGTSNLFAVYLAGAAVSWWDSEVPHPTLNRHTKPVIINGDEQSSNVGGSNTAEAKPEHTLIETDNTDENSGVHIFEMYYQPALQRILRPFFFASIGFSVPISQMFQGIIVWRGVVYSILMLIAKLVCGIWLVRVPYVLWSFGKLKGLWSRRQSDQANNKMSVDGNKENQNDRTISKLNAGKTKDQEQQEQQQRCSVTRETDERQLDRADTTINIAYKEKQQEDIIAPIPRRSNESSKIIRPQFNDSDNTNEPTNDVEHEAPPESLHTHQSPSASKPVSLYPGLIMGSAMVARGEIGFLISSLAQSNGIFDTAGLSSANGSEAESESSPIFLVVTWAIMLCTIVGPVTVGILVRRLNKLEKSAEAAGDRKEKDVLGVWGLS